MNIKEEIIQIIQDRKFAFDTQTLINDLTTRKIKTTKKNIIRILKNLGYDFDRHSKTWKKIENSVVYMPQIVIYVFNLDTKTMESQKLHILGLFYNKEKAQEHLELQKEFFIRLIETSQKKHPEYKINMSVNLISMDSHKSKEGFIFPTEYLILNNKEN